MRKGSCIYTLSGHNGPTSSISFSKTGDYFSTGSNDSLVILWKSNCLSTKKTYKNTLNSFPKQFLKDDPLNSPVKIDIDKQSSDNLSEQLASFFEKMVNQLQIVTKTIKKFDEKLDKLEDVLENFKLNESKVVTENEMKNKLNDIRNEYNNALTQMEGFKQSINQFN